MNRLAAPLLASLLAAGCGWTLRRGPVDEIRIGRCTLEVPAAWIAIACDRALADAAATRMRLSRAAHRPEIVARLRSLTVGTDAFGPSAAGAALAVAPSMARIDATIDVRIVAPDGHDLFRSGPLSASRHCAVAAETGETLAARERCANLLLEGLFERALATFVRDDARKI